MQLNVLILPGDGIGTEVTCEAVKVLERVTSRFQHQLKLTDGLLGGIAIHKTGTPLPQETVDRALAADATLMGAVGLPEFDNAPPEQRPERGLLGIRKVLGVYANLRPVRSYKALLDSSPLKNALVDGVDMIIVRELTGGIYYGTPRGIYDDGPEPRAVNTMAYTRSEIERVSRMAFHLARNRRKKVDQRRQIQRHRNFAALAQSGGRGCGRVSGRRAGSSAGGQLRHAIDPESAPLRRAGD